MEENGISNGTSDRIMNENNGNDIKNENRNENDIKNVKENEGENEKDLNINRENNHSHDKIVHEINSTTKWKKIKIIGRGGSSVVYEVVVLDSGMKFAAKEIHIDGLTKDQLLAIESEVETMKSLRHENIVNYFGTQHLQNHFYIFLEFADRGSLRQFYQHHGRLSEPQTSYCTKQILKGLLYLHSNGIAHRDIKGANVLLTKKGEMKLADFGASKRLDTASIVSGLKGTPHWMAPEVIKGTQLSTGWIKADVWSLGCTVVEMITGALPFAEYENPMTAMYQIASGKSPPIGSHITVSDDVTSFISACCAVDPMQRLSVDQLLTHPFVNYPHSDDHTLIVIPDHEDCADSDLPAINEESRDSPNIVRQSPSRPSSDQTENKKITNTEKGELTFKSRIPILQSRAIKVNVDSPDYPRKSIEEQVTPSIYKLRKTRESSVMPPNNPSPNVVQAPILTPTPPIGDKTNASTKFRKQTSRGLTNVTNESDSNKSTTPNNMIESPNHYFSDQELSPVNHHDHSNPSQQLNHDTSAPQLLPIESLKLVPSPDKLKTESTMEIIETNKTESTQVSASDQITPINSQDNIESLNYTYSEEFDSLTVSHSSLKETTPPQVISPKHGLSPVNNIEQVKSINSTKKKKDLRFDSYTAPNREKPDFLDDSDDNVPAILINGSLMNAKGSLVEMADEDYIETRPAAPLSSEKLNLCSDTSSSNLKKNSSKQSIHRQSNGVSNNGNNNNNHNQQLKPLRKLTRKFRSRSANPPSICGPSKLLLPPMMVHLSSDSRPISLMRGNIPPGNDSLNPPPSSTSSTSDGNGDGNGNDNLLSLAPPPCIPLLQLRMIQSAPTVTRSVNLPPILGSKTPSKKVQIEKTHHQIRKVTKKIVLASLQKKASFEEYEETGGILAPRR